MRVRSLLCSAFMGTMILASVGITPAHARWYYDQYQQQWYWCDDQPVVQQYSRSGGGADGGAAIGILSGIGLLIWMCCDSGSENSEKTEHDVSDADKARQKIELIELKQRLKAQKDYGGQFQELEWRKKIGEQFLYVAEQEAILDEHRQRIADRSRRGRQQLLTQRAELRADGLDTSEIDAALLGRGDRG